MLNYFEFIRPAHELIVENFLFHLAGDEDYELLIEAIPTSDFIKNLRKIGEKNANELGLDSTAKFESRIKQGFTEATKEIIEYPNDVDSKTKAAYNLFRQFLHERTSEASQSLADPSDNVYSAKTKVTFAGGNHKTKLSETESVLSKGLSLPPFSTAYPKFNCCPFATKECKASCLGLYAGGAKAYPETSFLGKLIRLQFMVEYPKETAFIIHSDLSSNKKLADSKGFLSGFRSNITSDIDFIKLFPKDFFGVLHKDTKFYDYTKDPSRLNAVRNDKVYGKIEKPDNYFISLSHTGSGHKESNDKEVIEALENGNVVTMVVAGKGPKKNWQVKGVIDDRTGKEYPVVSGDEDDNIFHRHKQAGVHPSKGVVSIVKLKGVGKEKAGKFVNFISDDGYVHINSKSK